MEGERRTREPDEDPEVVKEMLAMYDGFPEDALSLEEMIEKNGNSLRMKPKNDNRGTERHTVPGRAVPRANGNIGETSNTLPPKAL